MQLYKKNERILIAGVPVLISQEGTGTGTVACRLRYLCEIGVLHINIAGGTSTDYVQVRLPQLKQENPNMRLSQLKQALRKEWMKSPDNPLNKQLAAL
jgi:hypothetical protein